MTKFFAAVLVLFLAVSCSSPLDTAYVRSRVWVHNEGCFAGGLDPVDFSVGMYELKGDTIFYEGKPSAIVTSVSKLDNLLKIKSMDGSQSGTYLDKVEFTR